MQASRNWRARWLVSVLSLVLAAGTVGAIAAPTAATAYIPELAPDAPSAPGVASRALPRTVDAAATAALGSVGAAAFPQASSRMVTAGSVRAQIELLDQSAARAAGVSNGVVLRVSRLDRGTGRASVPVEVDYSGFARAFGGDYASRLRLVRLADGKVLSAHNNTRTSKLTAQVLTDPAVPSARGQLVGVEPQAAMTSQMFAVTAAADGPGGDFKASPLAPSGAWSVGLQSGDFQWSYPIAAPNLPGLDPQITLGYSSGMLDGRTSATNNQASWVGDGFSYEPGFIERSYRTCDDDGQSGVGDLCWASHNATLTLPGVGGELVRDDATGVWRSENDDSYRVELRTGLSNGDNDGEHWVVTASDGTQYHFGTRTAHNSTWTVPVFGDDAGEPCNGGSFASSWCQQAYRWQLDYVVDRHGDTMSLFYNIETNNYGRNNSPSSVTSYIRGGQLAQIEYGLRADAPAGTPAAGRVVFTSAGRCVGACATAPDFPDSPLDQQCDSGSCISGSPSFFGTKRLAKITTQVHSGDTYSDVDSWTLNHLFPATGDNESPALWLESIVHTGHAGPAPISMPEINFDGVQLRNRVSDANGTPLWKWRISKVVNETGGETQVSYASIQCAPASPHGNDQRCFPAFWTINGNPALEYFHKYVVAEVKDVDRVGGNPAEVTQYEYVGGPAWHYDDAELTAESRKTYGQLRGWQTVRVRTGDGVDSPQTLTEHVFLRGMDGDKLPDGSRRAVTVADSRGGSTPDTAVLRGFARETRVFNGVGGAWLSTTINEPWTLGPTAIRMRSAGPLQAYKTDVKVSKTWNALSDGSIQITEERETFDNFGRPVETYDLGDVTTTADDTCTRTIYAENQALWILRTPSTMEILSVGCDVIPTPADFQFGQRLYYDGSDTLGAVPTSGEPTRIEELAAIDGAAVRTYALANRVVLDPHGRVVESYDPSGDKTAISYVPSAGGPVTAITTTNALGHTESSVLDPLSGELLSTTDANGRTTAYAYDALGRLTDRWLPGRVKGTDSPNTTFGYLIRSNGPSAITTKSLRANGSYSIKYTLLDGFLQDRQTQAASPAGGRIIADVLHDSHGRIAKSNNSFYNSAAAGTTLFAAADTAVNGQSRLVYDGAGRESHEIFLAAGAEKWRTVTSYGGNWVAVQPPAGGTATMQRYDANGRITELRQFTGATPTGSYDATTYTYTKAGQLSTVTDPAGIIWRHSYDLRGREIRVEDPDKGASTMVHDDEDRLVSATDSRGRTLTYTYDALGRKTGMSEGNTLLASWEFDSLPGGKGLPAASTRFASGGAYRQEVLGYETTTGRLTGTAMVIPSSEGALAGRYETTVGHNIAGEPTSVAQPGVGGLPAETLNLGYNTLGMPTTLSSSLTTFGSLGYDNLGMVNLLTMGTSGKNVYQSYVVDKATRRLTRAIASRQGIVPNVLADANYTYDNSGNITKIADTPASQPALSDVQCFQYDYLQRLTQAWSATDSCAATPTQSLIGGAAPYWHSYTYDLSGNRQSEIQHNAGGDLSRTYNTTGHKLSSVVQSGRTDTFAYDTDGNMTSRAVAGVTRNLTWDAEGHLTSHGDTSHLYDANGGRLIRRDPTGTTLYLGTTELRLEGTVVAGTRYYSHGNQTIAVRKGAALVWLINNHQGTGGYAVNADNLSSVQRRYSLPFGGARGTAPSSWTGEKGFVGGVNDTATGLVHLGAREYDPAIGRFISVDPIIDVADPQQMHGYAYSENSPITKSDADGLKAKKTNKKTNKTKTTKKPKAPVCDAKCMKESDCKGHNGCGEPYKPPKESAACDAKCRKERNCQGNNGCGNSGVQGGNTSNGCGNQCPAVAKGGQKKGPLGNKDKTGKTKVTETNLENKTRAQVERQLRDEKGKSKPDKAEIKRLERHLKGIGGKGSHYTESRKPTPTATVMPTPSPVPTPTPSPTAVSPPSDPITIEVPEVDPGVLATVLAGVVLVGGWILGAGGCALSGGARC